MTEAFKELLGRESYFTASGGKRGGYGKERPTLVTLGGDHSIALAALRAVNQFYGPVAVLHFDARRSFLWIQ
jgi:agmatinase